MSTIGVYDYDFFNYRHVIPNLECAKLCTYFHNIHEIAVMTSRLNPAPYTQYYIRKEYNDGIFPRELREPNCIYGGRAFNPDKYSPLPPAIEKTIPNMHLYDKYQKFYCTTVRDKDQIKHILNCAHIRLSTDEETPKSVAQLTRVLETGRFTGIILHDYNLGKVRQAYDILDEIGQTRHYITKEGIRPYPIGNKFPIEVDSPEELVKWLKIPTMSNIFFLQYNGLMTDEVLYKLCVENQKMARQTYYNVTKFCSSENQFLMEWLPKILKQVLFLKRQHIQILLNYDEEFLVRPELKNLIELLNCFLRFKWAEEATPKAQSLYSFCKGRERYQYTTWYYRHIQVSLDESRDIFQFIRENNYELFKMFYEWDAVTYKEGNLVSDWD